MLHASSTKNIVLLKLKLQKLIDTHVHTIQLRKKQKEIDKSMYSINLKL